MRKREKRLTREFELCRLNVEKISSTHDANSEKKKQKKHQQSKILKLGLVI